MCVGRKIRPCQRAKAASRWGTLALPCAVRLEQSVGCCVSTSEATVGITFTDYASVIRRQSVIIILTTLLTIGAAIGLLANRSDVYEAAATVLVQPLTQDPLGGLGSGDRLVDLNTERQLVYSTASLSTLIDQGLADSVTALREVLRVETSEATQVLRIVASSPNPDRAVELADAAAEAYLAQRTGRVSDAVERTLASAQDRVSGLQEQLAEVLSEITDLDAALDELAAQDQSDTALDAQLADAQSRRAVLQAQLATASTSVSEILALQVDSGSIISSAVQPTDPVGPSHQVLLVLAAAFGALLGIVLAFSRERFDGRIHDAEHVERIIGAPVLATIPDRENSSGRDREQALRRLSVAIWAMRPEGGQGLALAYASVDAFQGRAALTYESARTLANEGSSVLVVDAARGSHGLHELVGLAPDMPGLMNLAQAPEPGSSTSSMIVPCGPVDFLPYGRLNDQRKRPSGEHLKSMVRHLTEVASLTVLHVPAVSESAESLEFQRWADGTVLFVRLGRTQVAMLHSTAREVVLSGGHVVGIVLVDGSRRRVRLPRRRDTKPRHPDEFSANPQAGWVDSIPAGSSG